MSVVNILSEQNPWWKNPRAIDENVYVRKWLNSKVKWFPDAYDIRDDPGIIYMIKGPRQVGKSTGIMLKIRELIKGKGVDPKDIVYIHCEAFGSRRELEDALRFVSKNKKKIWIFIDEATHIREWYVSIKYLKDINILNNAILIITGSSSLDLSKASSYLAGRRGEGKEYELDRAVLPLSFREFVEHVFNKLSISWLADEKIRRSILYELIEGKISEKLLELRFLWNEIQEAFNTYLLTGGFPLAIDEFMKKNEISSGIYNLYVNLIRRDLQRRGYDPYKVDQVLKKTIDARTNPISYEKIRAGTSIASTATIADYINALINSFVISQFLFFDLNRKAPVFRKERKYYVRDPFIFHAIRSWILGIEPFQSAEISIKDSLITGTLVEYVVGEHLIRLTVKENRRSLADPTSSTSLIGYWRSKGKEVDFILKLKEKIVPIELKYQESISKQDIKGLTTVTSMTGRKCILLTKNIDQFGEYMMHIRIPVTIFLLLI